MLLISKPVRHSKYSANLAKVVAAWAKMPEAEVLEYYMSKLSIELYKE